MVYDCLVKIFLINTLIHDKEGLFGKDMEEKALIVNEKMFEEKKAQFKQGGLEKFRIVSDFDRTLTHAFNEGRKNNTSFARIREGGYLPKEYEDKANALFDIYYPIEMDATIPVKEKKEQIREWFKKHLELMVEYGLTKEIIFDIIQNRNIAPRGGLKELFDYINEKEIPFLILSAGVGDIMKEFFKLNNYLSKNLHMVSNFLEWDNGKAISVNTPVICPLNKDEFEAIDKEFLKSISSKHNILLLGDQIPDLGMVDEESNNVLKIGFLDINVDKNLEEFKKNFDVILFGDGSLGFVNELLKELFG